MPSLSIVIPAYNEELRLPDTLNRLAAFLDHNHYDQPEVIVVDDGSSDGTAKLVGEWAAHDARFRLVRNAENKGKGYSVRRGMLAAAGDWRLMTDADLSTPIEELATLETVANKERAAVAIGSRAIDRRLVVEHQSWIRETGGRIFNLVMWLITGLPFADTQCGFKLYRADAAEAIFSRQILDGFSFDVEAVYVARRLSLLVIEVPVRWANSEGSTLTAAATVRAFAELFRIRCRDLRGRYRQH